MTVLQPPQTLNYSVHGAELRLLLPDGRTVVVACEVKTDWKINGSGGLRDCRLPPVDELVAEFNGKNAKLKWPVSLDGKKQYY